MDTTLNPKQADLRHALAARADEEFAHAYDQITRAGGEIARARRNSFPRWSMPRAVLSR